MPLAIFFTVRGTFLGKQIKLAIRIYLEFITEMDSLNSGMYILLNSRMGHTQASSGQLFSPVWDSSALHKAWWIIGESSYFSNLSEKTVGVQKKNLQR